MSQLIPLFSHPVLTIDDYPDKDAIADEFAARSIALMEEYPDAGLISDAWHSGKRAASRDDFERHGFTSFYNVNLGKRKDFDFINRAAMNIFAEYLRVVGKPELGMRLDNAWASVYGKGHYVPEHTHPLSHLSMAFYAAATEGTGQIVFDNPSRGYYQHFYPPEINWMPYRYSIQPQKGMFVVFPSYLLHHTEPHESDELRIIYSANVQLQYRKSTDADDMGESTQSDYSRET
ncbi:MAG: 2OG-Fe(II) oxygenase family protein [Gammaproteobacteria bacterium]|nr:2OG-Fe(II) oxygenase family protein [Gammaproteobacteria bacterium]